MTAQSSKDSLASNALDIEKAEVLSFQSLKRRSQTQRSITPGSDDNNINNNKINTTKKNDEEVPTLPFSKIRCIALVATVTGASFLNTLSLQSAVVILPTISKDLSIPESRQQWVLSSYTLTFGCFLLIWGRIADIYGRRFIFILGSAFVIPVTALIPLLRNEITFDLFRGLQGFGAAANVPTAVGILGVAFPPGKAKNYAFSAYSAGVPLGAIFGNILSGLVASYASWKWVFWVLAILATIITMAGIFFIPLSVEIRNPQLSLARSVDWIGGALITVGLMSLLFALTEGSAVGWSTPWIPMLMVIAFLLIFIFAAWQWYQENHTDRAPLLKISIFKNTHFSAAMILMGLFFGIFNNFVVYATYLWQDYEALNPVQTMLRFLPMGLCGIIVAIIISRLISKVPTYMMLMTGELAISISCLLMAISIPPNTSYFAYGFIAMILAVIGADTAWPTLTLFTSKSLPAEDQALGGALINASAQIGRALALAVTTAVQTAVMAHEKGTQLRDAGKIEAGDPASLKGIRVAYWLNFGLGLCCVVLCGVAFRGTGIVGKIPGKPTQEKFQQPTNNKETKETKWRFPFLSSMRHQLK